ncbi:ABC transporter ATP-binding protein [Bacillus sp. Bva_UNVM-123]|uniref:ABC transporter ATP-binding protein n=1 Tax=Bacillus sp. Bva_UNVM-123 TaxID=2829798 RepID=UPI00391EE6B9
MLKSIYRLVEWTGTRKKRIFIGFIYSIFHTICVAFPIIIAAFGLNFVLEDAKGGRPLEPSTIWIIALAMVAAVLGRFIFSYLRASTQESIGYEVIAEKRIQIGNQLKRVSLSFLQRHKAGDLTSAVTTDLSFIEMYGMKMIDVVVNGYISVLTIIIGLSFLHYSIAIVAVLFLICSALFLHLLSKESERNAPVYQQAKDEMISSTIEYIRGMAEVKSFKQQGVSKSGIQNAFKKSKEINVKIEKNYAPFNSLHILALHCATIGIVLTSSVLTLNGELLLSSMIMIFIFSFVMFQQIEAMNNASHVLKVINATLDKLKNIDTEQFLDDGSEKAVISNYTIQFKNVSFGYDNRRILHNVSFHLPENSTTALVGPSGSGKTTICKLIARFYDVKNGEINIGGVNIRDVKTEHLLKNISIVFQNVYLFHDTVFNNICFGRPKATFDEVVEVAKKARCHDFIMNLPDGYESVIGEGGSTLSGGEKQRISIARAMLKDSPIIVLDEATASVDPENEHEIQNALSELTKGKTVLIIAHRLATIENADQILVLNEGGIAQQGTHSQLIVEEGIYKKFCSIRKKIEEWSISH